MSEKQRIKRQTKSKIMHNDAIQAKIKERKMNRTELVKNAFVTGQMKMLDKIGNWLQLEYPKTGKKIMSKFVEFLKTQI